MVDMTNVYAAARHASETHEFTENEAHPEMNED
jgi:hypothetical protein